MLVRGSDWSSEFLARLAAEGAGEGGFSIRGGGAQLQSIPWQNVDQLIVRFSEEVNIFQSDLKLLGVNTAEVKVVDFDDTVLGSATWTFSAPLPADKLLLVLSDSITDVSGFPLDGNWTTGAAFPSGNGAIDTDDDFRFRFNVLPGDVTADASVSRADLIDQIHTLGAAASDAAYNVRFDTNGDGLIDLTDVRSLLGRIGTTLPGSEPDESSGAVRVAVDRIFTRIGAGPAAPAATLATIRRLRRVAGVESRAVSEESPISRRRLARRTVDLGLATDEDGLFARDDFRTRLGRRRR